MKAIRDCEDNEIVGYWRNHGYVVTITALEVKEYTPTTEWHTCAYSAARAIKDLYEQ